jgi:hypothetical protein
MTGRSDQKESKRPIQAEWVFGPLREIALRKGCGSNGKLCSNAQVNIPWVRLIDRALEVAWCGERLFWVKGQADPACWLSRQCVWSPAESSKKAPESDEVGCHTDRLERFA